jgi:serine beta-lactamase-like protein LACTB
MNQQLPEAISQAQAIIQSEVASKVPGGSVAVAVNGALVWSEAFGYADFEAKTPATRETRFRVGSVSKPFTSAGLALLVERGQLDLDAPIQKYIPDFPQKEGVITTRLLAWHLAGIRHYRGREAVSNQPFPNLRSGLKIFENDPLESPPGTKYNYSSYGWNTIGVVMEAAAKQDFLAFMDENVFKPLGMSNTRADRAGIDDALRTLFYEAGLAGEFFTPPAVDLSYCWPAGGYLSTTKDMACFGCALVRPGFLTADSLKLIFTTHNIDGKPTNYGMGWFIGPGTVYHGGDSMGGTATLLLFPAPRIVVALATNCGHGALLNAIRLGRAPKEAVKFLFAKDVIAHKIAKVFSLELAKLRKS